MAWVQKFIGGDDALAFVADVHQDFLGADFDDGAFDDFALGKAVLCFRASSMVSIIILTAMNCGRLRPTDWDRRLHCLTNRRCRGNGG
jgi:hypothetical protein